MVTEGFAVLRILGDNMLVTIGLNLSMIIILVYTVATVIGGIIGASRKTKA